MKLVSLDKPPVEMYTDFEISVFSTYEIEKLEKEGIQEAYYWYTTGAYEGYGDMLHKRADGKWDTLGLGHCSCYGPIENLDTAHKESYDTLDALYKSCSEEYKKSIAPLIELAQESEK